MPRITLTAPSKLRLGTESYQLADVYDAEGSLVPLGILSDESRYAFLIQPTGDLIYGVNAILSLANDEVQQYVRKLGQEYLTFDDLSVRVVAAVTMTVMRNKDFVNLELKQFDELLTASTESGGVIIKLILDNQDHATTYAADNPLSALLGYLLIKHNTVTIFSEHSIKLSGTAAIASLCVRVLGTVCIEQSLSVTANLAIYCKSLDIWADGSASEPPLITAPSFSVLAAQRCYLAGNILASASIKIKAGKLTVHGVLECHHDIGINIEQADVYGEIFAKGALHCLFATWRAHDTSHVHAGIVQYMGITAELGGILSNCGLRVLINKLRVSGKIYVQGNTLFSAMGPFAAVDVQSMANLVINGNFDDTSTWVQWFAGHLINTDQLEVFWKNIIDPLQPLSEDEFCVLDLPTGLISRSATTLQPLQPLQAVVVRPYIKPSEYDFQYRLYDKTQFIALRPMARHMAAERPDEKGQAKRHISLTAAVSLKFSGDVYAPSTVVALQSGGVLDFSGHIWNISACDDVLVYLKSHELHVTAGSITTTGPVMLEASGAMSFSGSVTTTAELTLKTEGDLTLKNSRLAAAKSIRILAHNSRIDKEYTVSLISPTTVFWLCKDSFRLFGRLEFANLYLRAERTVRIHRAVLDGSYMTCEARYFVSSFSKLVVERQFAIVSRATLHGFSYIASNNYYNNSLINLSVALFTPASLRLDLSSVISIAAALINTGLAVVQLCMPHDPVAQLAVIITRVVLNCIPAAYGVYRLAHDLYQAAHKPTDEFTQLRLALQTKNVLFSLASLSVGMYMAVAPANLATTMSAPHMPLLPASLDDAVDKVESITSALFTILPGKHDSAMLNVDAGVALGLENSDMHVVNVDFGAKGFLSTFNTAVIQLNGPLALNAACYTANMHLYAVDFGNPSPLPLGYHTYRAYEYYSAPLFANWSRTHLNMDTYALISAASSTWQDATIHTDHWVIPQDATIVLQRSFLLAGAVDNHGIFTAKNSSLHLTRQWDNDIGSRFQATKAYIDICALHNAGMMQSSESVVKLFDVNNQGVALYFYSSLNAHQLNNAGIMQIFATYAQIDIGINNTAALFVADGQSTITGGTFTLAPDSRMDSRTSSWQLEHLNINQGHFNVNGKPYDYVAPTVVNPIAKLKLHPIAGNMFKHYAPKQLPHPHLPHDITPDDAFSYTSASPLTAQLNTDGTIVYTADQAIVFKDDVIESFLPLAFQAPRISLQGHEIIDCPVTTLQGDTVTFNGGDTTVHGNLVVYATDKIESSHGAKVATSGDLSLVTTAGSIVSHGQKTVTTHTEKHQHWLRKDKIITTTTSFKNNEFIAGGNLTLASQAAITLDGTDVMATQDVQITAQHDVVVTALRGTNAVTKDHENFIFHSDHEQVLTDVVSPSTLYSDSGKIAITTSHGDVLNKNSYIVAPEAISVAVPTGHNFNNDAVVLQKTVAESHCGLYLSNIAGIPLAGNYEQWLAQMPICRTFTQFNSAGDAMEQIAGITHGMGTGINLMHRLLIGARQGDPLSAMAALFGITPSVTLQFNKSSSHMTHQEQGPGGISTKALSVTAGAVTFAHNFHVTSATTNLNVDKLEASGVCLTSTAATTGTTVGVTVNLVTMKPTDVTLTHEQQHMHQEQWDGTGLKLGDCHFAAVPEVNLDGVQLQTTTLSGHVATLRSTAALVDLSASGYEGGITYGGSFTTSYNNSATCTTVVTTPISVTDTSDFTLETVDLTGQTAPDIVAQHTQYTPLHNVSQYATNLHLSAPFKNTGDVCTFVDLDYNHGDSHWRVAVPTPNTVAISELRDNTQWLITQWQAPAAVAAVRYDPAFVLPAITLTGQLEQQQLVIDVTLPTSESPITPITSIVLKDQDNGEDNSNYNNDISVTDIANYEHEDISALMLGDLILALEKNKAWIFDVNETFQSLLRSDQFLEYIIPTLSLDANVKNVVFDWYKEFILDPHIGLLSQRPYHLWNHNSTLFLNGVYEQPNILQMIATTGQNFEQFSRGSAKWLTALNSSYFIALGFENYHSIVDNHESPYNVFAEEGYSLLGGVIGESIISQTIKYLPELLSHGPLACGAKVFGTVGGGILGEKFIAHELEEGDDYVSPELSLLAAKEALGAADLRKTLLAELSSRIPTEFTNATSLYKEFWQTLYDDSSRIGQAIAVRFKLTDDLLRIVNLTPEGDAVYFKSLLEKFSDFSVARVATFENLGRAFLVSGLAEGAYDIYEAQNRCKATIELVYAYLGTELGTAITTVAVAAVCPESLPVIFAGSLLGGIGGNELARHTFPHVETLVEDILKQDQPPQPSHSAVRYSESKSQLMRSPGINSPIFGATPKPAITVPPALNISFISVATPSTR